MNGWTPNLIAAAAWLLVPASVLAQEATDRLDPAAWGRDHVGKPMPAYVTGDECLFCHRKIGPSWPENRHQLTIQAATAEAPAVEALRERSPGQAFADQTRMLLGSRRATRFLKRSPKYGRLEMLTTVFFPLLPKQQQVDESPTTISKLDASGAGPHWKDFTPVHWDKRAFGDRCAGCHTTGVDTETKAFSAISLDCYTCHGDVNLAHTKDVSQVLLSTRNREARQVVSICSQCHLRGGKSKSSGHPYPNTFVAGDNLFRDFQVEFSERSIQSLPAADRHIFANARDIAVLGKTGVTCLNCHDVHRQSSDKHQELPNSAICATCHAAESGNTTLSDAYLQSIGRNAHSPVCEY